MKILYIHQYFRTPYQPGGTRSYWFCRELIENGYNVVMLTSRDAQQKLVEKEIIDGIEIIYVRNAYNNQFGIFKRAWSFFRFMIISTYLSLKEKNISLVIATSTPLSIGFPALMCKWFRSKKFIFEVRDLWPEVPIQLGAFKNIIIKSTLISFEKKIYKNSSHIITLSPGMKEGVLKRGIKEEKVSMIPNMSKVDKFYARKKDQKVMEQYGLLDDRFYVIHFGTMGIANGLDYIIDAAKILKDKKHDKIEFLFAGKGSVEEKLKSRCENEKINNVRFLGTFDMHNLSKIVNIANCSIVPFKNIEILKTNSPNKLFDSLSAQKPIIVNSNGWTKEMIESNNCGAYVNPNKPEHLAEVLIDWQDNNEQMLEMAKNARLLAEQKYDKSILVKKWYQTIKKFL